MNALNNVATTNEVIMNSRLVNVNSKLIEVICIPEDFSSYIEGVNKALKGLYDGIDVYGIKFEKVYVRGIQRFPVYNMSYTEFLHYMRHILGTVKNRLYKDIKTLYDLSSEDSYFTDSEKQDFKQDMLEKMKKLNTLTEQLAIIAERINKLYDRPRISK